MEKRKGKSRNNISYNSAKENVGRENMAIEICMTEAGIGDCILIRCGKSEKKVNILIDSGQGENVFDSVLRRVLRNEEKVDLLILTHDDNDHVKGACNLLERVSRVNNGIENQDIPTGRIFSNLTEEQIVFNFGGNGAEALLAARDIKKLACSLKEKIDFHKLGFVLADDMATDERPFPNVIQLRWETTDNILSSNVIRSPKLSDFNTEMEHLEIVILSPKKEMLAKYIQNAWSELNREELLSGCKVDDKNEWEESIQYWFEHPVRFTGDDKMANNASIAFLLIYDGHYMLFSGDASSDQMVEAGKDYLRRIGREEEFIKLDLIKLPHHGSSHNLSREFLEVFQTKRYLISTSGHKGYRHPGKGALAQIAAVLNCEETAEIYCNYNWWNGKSSFWRAEAREGNWDKNCCTLKGKDGDLRYLDFFQLDTVPIMVSDNIWLST